MMKRILSLILAVCTVAALFAVFPIPAATADEEKEEVNLALNKPVTVSRDARLARMVNDGNENTSWTSNWIPLYAEIDLEALCRLDRVVVKMPMKNSDVISYEFAFNIYASVDGVNFDRIGEMKTPEKVTAAGFVFTVFRGVPYRFVRVMSTMSTRGSYSSTAISEIEVYGTPTDEQISPVRTSIDIPSYDEWLYQYAGVDLSTIKDENGKYRVSDTYTREDTVAALNGLVTRVLGAEYVDRFLFEVTDPLENGNDYYEISDDGGKIRVKGNKGVSIAAGLNHYLKYYCLVNVSQETSRVRMPEQVVPVGETIHTETTLPVRYTYNYCTLSYTMPYYGFDEWQRELDYLMLSGINVVLDTTATEALWVLYLQKFGYTLEEAKQFVCGYTWKAWWLMGNLEGYGGPVSDAWIVDTVEMARVNQRYLAVMGADPCLQAFVGTLPTNFSSKAKSTLTALGFSDISAKMTSTGSWSGFTRPYALNTDYDGFDYLAKTFYEVQDYIYGRIGDYYAGDFLHEISGGFKLDPQFNKANMSRAVLDKLIEENDKAVWIIQSWWENPLPEVVAGWGDDREDHMLLLDLAAAKSPRWKNTKNYGGLEFGGSSWCYCILENYGGRDGAHLNLKLPAKAMSAAMKKAEHMKGIGLTSEGTERNPVVFDLFWELAWYPDTDAREWIASYAVRRFGTADAAAPWTALLNTIYGTDTVDGTTINCAIGNYPKFDYTGAYFYPSYNREKLDAALRDFLALYDLCKDEETYVYDMVELFATELSNFATKRLEAAFGAAKTGDYASFLVYKNEFLQAIRLIDELNAFEKHQTLGNWVGRVDTFVNDSRTGVYSDFDVDLMKLDAVILITNWSTIDLGNYANRLYNGLVSSYYYTMWNTFMQSADQRLKKGGRITAGDDRLEADTTYCYNVGRQTALDVMFGKNFPSQPVPVDGDYAHRSLKEVLEEIARCCFVDGEGFGYSATLKEGSALALTGTAVSGSVQRLTAAEVAAQFVVSGAEKAGVSDNGRLLGDAETPAEGMKIVLVSRDGTVLDCLDITLGKITENEGGKAAFDALKERFASFRTAVSLIRFDDPNSLTAASILSYAAAVDRAIEGESTTALTALEQKLPDASAALETVRENNLGDYMENLPFDPAALIAYAAANAGLAV